jgi:hypothetical protein
MSTIADLKSFTLHKPHKKKNHENKLKWQQIDNFIYNFQQNTAFLSKDPQKTRHKMLFFVTVPGIDNACSEHELSCNSHFIDAFTKDLDRTSKIKTSR